MKAVIRLSTEEVGKILLEVVEIEDEYGLGKWKFIFVSCGKNVYGKKCLWKK